MLLALPPLPWVLPVAPEPPVALEPPLPPFEEPPLEEPPLDVPPLPSMLGLESSPPQAVASAPRITNATVLEPNATRLFTELSLRKRTADSWLVQWVGPRWPHYQSLTTWAGLPRIENFSAPSA